MRLDAGERDALEKVVSASLKLALLRHARDTRSFQVYDRQLIEAEGNIIRAADGLPRRDNW